MSQQPVSMTGDLTAKAPALDCYPIHTAPDLYGSSCWWWAQRSQQSTPVLVIVFFHRDFHTVLCLIPHLGPIYLGCPCQGHIAPDNIAPRIIRAPKPLNHGKVAVPGGDIMIVSEGNIAFVRVTVMNGACSHQASIRAQEVIPLGPCQTSP